METLVLEKVKHKAKKNQKKLAIQDFLTLQGQSEQVFEYHNGELVTISAMKNQERIIVDNILRKFNQTNSYLKEGNSFLPETDCWLTPKQMRRPDISFFTRAQIEESAEGKNPIPAFVIEIISEYDNMNYVEGKTKEYFEAGVRLVWHIFPDLLMVRVFKNLKEARTFFDNDELTASPVIDDLILSVEEVFKKK